MRKMDVDDVNLNEIIEITESFYPSFKWKRHKKGEEYRCSMDAYGGGSYKWVTATRDEFIFIMSGLIASAEYWNKI